MGCDPIVIPALIGLPMARVQPYAARFASIAAAAAISRHHPSSRASPGKRPPKIARRFPVRSDDGHDPIAGCSAGDVVTQPLKLFHHVSPDGTGSRWPDFCPPLYSVPGSVTGIILSGRSFAPSRWKSFDQALGLRREAGFFSRFGFHPRAGFLFIVCGLEL